MNRSEPPSPPRRNGRWRQDLRVRILAVALIPLLGAVILLSGYFAHRQIDTAWQGLEERGRLAAQRLADTAAFDLFAGNRSYLKRLIDYELASQGYLGIGIADHSGQWWLVSGQLQLLPRTDDLRATRAWRSDGRYIFVHPVRLPSPIQDDPYLASGTPPVDTVIGQVTVVLSSAPVEATRQQVLFVTLGAALLLLAAAGGLAWRLSQALSRPLHRAIAAVREIGQGNLDTRLQEKSSGEIGELERGINAMTSVIQQHDQAMQQRIADATAELRAQTEAAEAAVQARSRFLAAASHDLRQPMHALSLLVEALLEKLPKENGDIRRLAESIEASAHAMQSLLNALLDLSRLDAGVVVARPECFLVTPLLERLAGQYAEEAAARRLNLRVHPSDMAVFTDPVLLERILGNLIANAIRYTDRGGVLIGLRRVQKDWVRFEVWDTGKGVPEEYRERIFEEYFQLGNPERGRDKGLGLGLAIVKRLARLLGSPVEVRSAPGRGSCFRIRAARCEPPPVAEPPAAQVSFAAAENAPRKLVVFIDDDYTILEAMSLVFEQWDIDLAVGTDAQEVRNELLDLARAPDAILSDYRLREGRTGIEAIQTLRETFGAAIPAALITGDTAAPTLQAIGASGLPVIYKPLKPANLRAFLHHLLSGGTTGPAPSARP